MNQLFPLIASITLLVSVNLATAGEPSAFEMTCRMKAKEIAAETYRGCVVENRKAQIDQVKSDYQAKLKALKDEYEQELKKAAGSKNEEPNGNSSTLNQNSSPAPSSVPAKSKVTKSNLPAKVVAVRSNPSTHKKSARENTVANDGMNVQLKQINIMPTDDSTMDIPEPIPVEKLESSSDSQI